MAGLSHESLKDELLKFLPKQNNQLRPVLIQEGSDYDKKSTLDHLIRDVLQSMVMSKTPVPTYHSFIDFAINCVKQDACSISTLFVIISDIFDMVTLNVCSEIFCHIEDKVETWKSDIFYNAGKNYLLRMCNDLLRRLSKTKNTVFCGRIQLFLAHLFPLEEKSGLNLMSNFNVENVTVYNMDIVDEFASVVQSTDGDDSMKAPIDQNLYKKFWSLQNYFHKPLQCYDKNAWNTFIGNVEEVLNCFESYKLEDVRVSYDESVSTDNFFAKYLTSDKLLNLQLSDTNFRRNILLQLLVLFQYLTSHVKFKAANNVLSDDQVVWLKKNNARIYKILLETPPDGPLFAQIVEHLLNREDNWNSWKNEGCSSFIRNKIDSKKVQLFDSRKRKRCLANELKMDHLTSKLGNTELTRLWNLEPDNVVACKAKKRNFLASFDDFFGEAIEQLDPAASVEDQYKLIYDPTYAWKSLRLLAARSSHFFAQHQGNASNNPIKTTAQYLEQIINKHAKEIMANSVARVIDAEESNVDYAGSIIKKEMDLTEGYNSSTDQEQTLFEQIDDMMSLVKGNWKILALCLNISEDKIQYFEKEEMSTEQIFAEIFKSYKDSIHNVTIEKVESVIKSGSF